MTPAYILTATAADELRDIIAYTYTRWGDHQASAYSAKLLNCMNAVATGHGTFRDMQALHPSLRMIRCARHYIFCLMRENDPALIVALLHERMDLMTRLADRLGT
ncbi:plasmid stabilization protein [Sphingobium indicum BiD32]|uniref:Plasmid stabilization protein n=1 Tax=Sphingobium indicum BiD32 TaxID=1301087 RepID=N1MRA8_9SPHN|nr:type II toxin-antitoxin system RelE/ParE family toxin [Sphingobium indicum]CCW19491.1 plasmid stabilization protein [Sphingobium indicum BiD32]